MFPSFEYSALLKWHTLHGRHTLPWRQFNNLNTDDRAYRIWLSEILLQQTQADRVISFYNRILEQYPTIQDLAQASYEEFFPYYQGLGYYSRARNLLKTAGIIVREYSGVFPQDSESLIQLPGVGPYTAEAIRAFAYDIPTLSFDTNLDKIFARYYYGSRYIKLTKNDRITIITDFKVQSETDLTLFGRSVNAALMDLGALWSINSLSNIEYTKSPFKNCKFTQTQGSLEIAPIKQAVYFPTPDARIFVILHRDHREYYSNNLNIFIPFELEPMSMQLTHMDQGIPSQKIARTLNKSSIKNDPRHTIQSYFRSKYGLELSVRPPRVRGYSNWIPYIVVYAQVQSGEHTFEKCSKETYQKWSEKDPAI